MTLPRRICKIICVLLIAYIIYAICAIYVLVGNKLKRSETKSKDIDETGIYLLTSIIVGGVVVGVLVVVST